MKKQELIEENNKLKADLAFAKSIIADIIWMARRYADGRSTYAPAMVNEAIDFARNKLSIEVAYDSTIKDPMYATDGSFGKWNSQLQKFTKECQACEINDFMLEPEE